MVRKVVTPASTSVWTLVARAVSWKKRSSVVIAAVGEGLASGGSESSQARRKANDTGTQTPARRKRVSGRSELGGRYASQTRSVGGALRRRGRVWKRRRPQVPDDAARSTSGRRPRRA